MGFDWEWLLGEPEDLQAAFDDNIPDDCPSIRWNVDHRDDDFYAGLYEGCEDYEIFDSEDGEDD